MEKRGILIIIIIVIVVLIILSVLFRGNEDRFLTDPLYCKEDSDCTRQATACHGCGCPEPINIYNRVELDCEPSEYACTLECEFTIPKCINNECKLLASVVLD